jgi:hypothetical protein
MKRYRFAACAILCCAVCSGCGLTKIADLSVEVEKQKQQVAKLEKEKAELQAKLADANRELEKVARIRKGYELARTELKKQLAQLVPLVGGADSPLPSFDDLQDTKWIGSWAPAGKIASGLKDLQLELKGLLGGDKEKPKP